MFYIFSKVLTGADDTIMKVFSLAEGSVAESGEPLDLEAEIFTMTSNQEDTVAIGGEDRKVFLHRIEEDQDGTLRLAEGDK